MVPRPLIRQRWLAALGQDSRMRLVARLAQGSACVSQLAAGIALSQSCTTRHVQALALAGLVTSARDGKRVMVRLRSETPGVPELLAWLGVGGGAAGGPADAPPGRPARPRRRAAALPSATLPAVAASPVEVSPAFDMPISDISADVESDHPSPLRQATELEDYLL